MFVKKHMCECLEKFVLCGVVSVGVWVYVFGLQAICEMKDADSVCAVSVKMMKDGCKSNKAEQRGFPWPTSDVILCDPRLGVYLRIIFIHHIWHHRFCDSFHKMFVFWFSWNVQFINALGFLKVNRGYKCELTHPLRPFYRGPRQESSTSWCRSRTVSAQSHALSWPFVITQTSSLGNLYGAGRHVSDNEDLQFKESTLFSESCQTHLLD